MIAPRNLPGFCQIAARASRPKSASAKSANSVPFRIVKLQGGCENGKRSKIGEKGRKVPYCDSFVLLIYDDLACGRTIKHVRSVVGRE